MAAVSGESSMVLSTPQGGRRSMVSKPGGLEQAACDCADEDGRSEGELSNRSPPL